MSSMAAPALGNLFAGADDGIIVVCRIAISTRQHSPAPTSPAWQFPRLDTSRRPTAWLGWSDSNCGIRWDQNPRVLPGKILAVWPRSRSRDGSRSSCGVANVQLRQGFRLAWAHGKRLIDQGLIRSVRQANGGCFGLGTDVLLWPVRIARGVVVRCFGVVGGPKKKLL
jgi:hypothetical protein